MAKIKDTPNLPGSSRMQMPSTAGNGTMSLIKEVGGMKNGKATANVKGGSVASKVIGAAKGKKGIKSMNPYGPIC